jgi:hypothetical protein
VAKHQRTCSKTCGAALRKKTQAAWRARNPGYAIERRVVARGDDARAEAPRMPPPLSRLPWDVAKDVFGGQGAEFIGAFGRLIVGAAKDVMRPQVPDTS